MAKLGDICTINMGQSPESSSYNTIGDGLPFFQGNADFGDVHPTIRTWCSNPIKIAQKDDILISVRAPIGALNIANQRCCIGRGLASLTNYAKKIYRDYLWFALFSKIDELNTKGTGSTFKAINKKILAETDIPLPSLKRQEQIVKQLSCLDTLLSRKKQQLSKLDQLVKSRFIEMFGDPVKNPYHWTISRLEHSIKFITSGSRGWSQYFSNDGELFITIKNVKNSKIIFNEVQYIHPPKNAEAARTKVQEDDLLISITADLGRTGVVTKFIAEKGAYINQHLTCIRLDKSKLLPIFVSYFLESPAGKKQFSQKNQTGVKAGLNFDAIKSLQIFIPPLSLQEQFASFVQQVDKIKSSVKQSLEKLETLKNSLMQEYFG